MRTISVLTFHLIIGMQIYGQAGSLDPNFDADGKLVTDVSSIGSHDGVRSVVVQPDGKILVGGYANEASGGMFALVRYYPDGSLDNTFGSDGIVTTGFGPESAGCYAIALQEDGKIVAAGTYGSETDHVFALARYIPNGSLDDGFGVNGKVLTDVLPEEDQYLTSMSLQSDGKIVVGGYIDASFGASDDCVVLRYLPNGTLDASFSFDGKVITDLGANDRGNALAVQPDGKILLAGQGGLVLGESSSITLLRYDPDGVLDDTFGSNGVVITENGDAFSTALAMALLPDGKIVLTGDAYEDTNMVFGVVRFNSDGTLDNSFHFDGRNTFPIGIALARSTSVCVQADGRIFLGGYANINGNYDFALARFNEDGSVDTNFGSNGSVTTSIGPALDYARSIAIQSDGKVLLAGITEEDNDDFALVRYRNDLDIGVVEFGTISALVEIYPSPIGEAATLAYELKTSETLNCDLFDAQGRLVKTMFSKAQRSAGVHQESLYLSGIAAGEYSLVLSNGSGRTTVKVVKE